MKYKIISIISCFSAVASFLLIQGCEKDDTVKILSISTEEVTQISFTSAKSGGEIPEDENSEVLVRGVVWSQNKYPTIYQNEGITDDGEGHGKFESNLSEMLPDTKYYVRAYAVKSQETEYGNMVDFTTESRFKPGEGVTDIDGNEYKTVFINNREWMAENLRTTRYADGTVIPGGLPDADLQDPNEGAFGVYPFESVSGLNSEEEVVESYGKLYNWHAVDDERGLCPAGWYVPTNDEWTGLLQYLQDVHGVINYHHELYGFGNVLKKARQVEHPWGGEHATEEHPRWDSPQNTTYYGKHHGTDDFGFSALPGGYLSRLGNFEWIGRRGLWWTSNNSSGFEAYSRGIYHSDSHIYNSRYRMVSALSVRCIRDPE